MKLFAIVILFAACTVGAFYAHNHHLKDAEGLLTIAAAISFFLTWTQIED